MAACLALADGDLAGDCALAVARQASRGAEGEQEAFCPRIPAGPWRDECWFEAAEARRRSDPDQAVALCQRAGAFRED